MEGCVAQAVGPAVCAYTCKKEGGPSARVEQCGFRWAGGYDRGPEKGEG